MSLSCLQTIYLLSFAHFSFIDWVAWIFHITNSIAHNISALPPLHSFLFLCLETIRVLFETLTRVNKYIEFVSVNISVSSSGCPLCVDWRVLGCGRTRKVLNLLIWAALVIDNDDGNKYRSETAFNFLHMANMRSEFQAAMRIFLSLVGTSWLNKPCSVARPQGV